MLVGMMTVSAAAALRVLLLVVLLSTAPLHCHGQNYFLVQDSFYLKLSPLDRGFGSEGRRVLLRALADFNVTFEEAWTASIEASGGSVDTISTPDFDIVRDIGIGSGERPSPDLYPDGSGGFVQKCSYLIQNVFIDNTPELMRDEWTAAAFSGNAFLPFLQARDAETQIFANVTTVEFLSTFQPEYKLYTDYTIQDHPFYLELGPEDSVTTSSQAGRVVASLDTFFEDEIVPFFLNQQDEEGQEEIILYGFSSPFLGGGYFQYGSYNLFGGELVDSYSTSDGSIVTKYEYRYDVHFWLKDTIVNATNATERTALVTFDINHVFDDNALLPYLQAELVDRDYWQDITFVNALEQYRPTPAPSSSPMPTPVTMSPSSSPIISPTPSPQEDTSSTPSPDATTTTSCSIQINQRQCPQLMTSEIATIPCDCLDKCITFIDGSFEKCDNGSGVSSTGTIVAGCTAGDLLESFVDTCGSGSSSGGGGDENPTPASNSQSSSKTIIISFTSSMIFFVLGWIFPLA